MKGNRIKLLREEKKIKQEELAKILSISPSAIGMYERDEREPNDELTLKLAEYFNVTTDYLLGKSDIRNSDKQINDVLNEAMIGMSKEDYESLSETQKQQIRDFARFILKDNKKENN